MKRLFKSRERQRIVFANTYVIFVISQLFLSGCNGPVISSAQQKRAFELAGPIRPQVDIDSLIKAKTYTGTYRVVTGDILELQMPAIVRAASTNLSDLFQEVKPYFCRVSDKGTIALPIVGEIEVANKKLSEIETLISETYFPKYVISPPAAVCKVSEYQTQKVSIIGAVEKPGIYPLRHDEMSLVSLLMKADGIIKEGAGSITIRHRRSPAEDKTSETDRKTKNLINAVEPEVNTGDIGEDEKAALKAAEDRTSPKPIVLPVKGLNIPFADVALLNGDIVEVEQFNPQVFTVIGLVKRPDAFPYPQNVQYNLMEALAFAGRPDLLTDPHYVTIYRQDAGGKIVSATFGIDNKSFAKASNVLIKQGAVISVNVTARTRIIKMFAEMFYVHVGVDPVDLIRESR